MLSDPDPGAKQDQQVRTMERRIRGMTLDLDRLGELLQAAAGNILDLREAAQHAAGHLPGSASLPLLPALAAVPPRSRAGWLAANLPSIFLPPHHEPLLVVTDRADLAAEVVAHLTERGRPWVESVVLEAGTSPGLPPELIRRGRSARVLWKAPLFLRRWAHLLPPPAAGPVLDLACGSGRASVWLAQRGYRVTGLDHQPEALALAQRLARSCGVRIDLGEVDLRRPQSLPAGPWSAVLMLRFLDRDLVRRLPGCLGEAGVVMLSTFRDAPGYLGNPRPQHRLRGGEAAGWWRTAPGGPAAGTAVEILVHEEGFDDDGRPSAGVVARFGQAPWLDQAPEGGGPIT